MLLLVDEDVPSDVVRFLQRRGHEVRLVRDELAKGAPDPAVARAASELGAVVVTWNRRHYQALMKRRNKRGQASYPNLGLIAFNCSHVQGLSRLEDLIELVEYEYEQAGRRQGGRLNIEIGWSSVRILR